MKAIPYDKCPQDRNGVRTCGECVYINRACKNEPLCVAGPHCQNVEDKTTACLAFRRSGITESAISWPELSKWLSHAFSGFSSHRWRVDYIYDKLESAGVTVGGKRDIDFAPRIGVKKMKDEDGADVHEPKTSAYMVRNTLIGFQNELGFDDEMTEREGRLVDSVIRSLNRLLAHLEKCGN
jgi:hypothetical protein